MTESPLFKLLQQVAGLQRQAVDRLALTEACMQAQTPQASPREQLDEVCRLLTVPAPQWQDTPDAARLPAVVHLPERGWGLVIGQDPGGHWIVQLPAPDTVGSGETHLAPDACSPAAHLNLRPAFTVGASPVWTLIATEIRQHRRVLAEAALGSGAMALLGLLVSFYSLQVYDRVIPTGGLQTLLVLSIGALLAIAIDWLARRARAQLYERLIESVDQRLARSVYLRLLAVRLDQLPASVGTLAGQLRGYESVRAFLTGLTGSLLVDVPFLLFYLLIIALVGGVLVLVPLAFLVAAVLAGHLLRRPIEQAARTGMLSSHFRTGLLVETVEGAETIKSGQAGWRMLGRWLKTTQDARESELQSRRIHENYQHLMSAFQQFSYTLLVAFGAWRVTRGDLTMGGLIACTILAGRVLNPIATLSGQALQWAHVKAALEGLDALWRLEDDHQGQDPVIVDEIHGHFRFDQVRLRYGGRPALAIPRLEIRPGERIGIVGPVGAGKTSLLRALSGLYKPDEGRVLLDDLDLAQISRQVLARQVGYLQQEGRLFAGTLRDNLVLGLTDPGDAALVAAARATGLLQTVIAPHPKGLEQPIHEGGIGLSGGQRQLVNLTRVVLRKPRVWLLDEPTASVDSHTERQIVDLLDERIDARSTLVLVTHKPELLKLVDRLIVVAQQQVVMDGPRDAILARLRGTAGPAAAHAETALPARELQA